MPLPSTALYARAAHDVRLPRNEVAYAYALHTVADLFDDAAPFVADNARRMNTSGGPRIPLPDVVVGPADARSLDADLDRAVFDRGLGYINEFAAGGGLRFGNGFHGDRFSFRDPLYSAVPSPGGGDLGTTTGCCNISSVERRRQLLPNHDFRDGLNGWETTGRGATLIRSGGVQILSLVSNGSGPVALTSEPVSVVPGATYRAGAHTARAEGQGVVRVAWADEKGRALGHAEFPVVGREWTSEVQAPPEASFAFIGIGTSGGSFAIRSLNFEPVGPRLSVSQFVTVLPVIPVGKVSVLRCLVCNTGSEPLEHPVAELRAGRELLAPGVEAERTLPSLRPGESVAGEWPILPLDPGLFGAVVRVRSGGFSAESGTDIVASEPPFWMDAQRRGVWVRRSVVSVATPSFRVVLPRSEFGFGAGQFELGDPLRFAGWVRALATAVGEQGEPPRALYGKRSRVESTSLTMSNHDRWATWGIAVTPKPERTRLALVCRYTATQPHRLTALQGASICLPDGAEPTDYAESQSGCAMTMMLGNTRYGIAIHWPQHDRSGGSIVTSKARSGRLSVTLVPDHPALRPGVELTLSQELWMGRARSAKDTLEH